MSNQANAQVWATAISKDERKGTAIVFRFIKEFDPKFKRDSQPVRIILVWKYHGENGMPSIEERARMDELEDTLEPFIEIDGFSTLALVSTGENLREWIYYAKSESDFLDRLNKALWDKSPYPIEIHAAADPEWSSYENFRKDIK